MRWRAPSLACVVSSVPALVSALQPSRGIPRGASSRAPHEATELELEEDVARFRAGLAQLVSSHGFVTSEPIVATASDSFYLVYLPKWSERLSRIGLKQQVIVALDEPSAYLAAESSLPALDIAGAPVAARGARRTRADSSWHLPAKFSITKFMVSMLLLEANFSRVLFSELDVFMWRNPVPLIDGVVTPGWWNGGFVSSNAAGATYVAMMNDEDNRTNGTNIGFVQFHGGAGATLLRAVLQRCARVGPRELRKLTYDQTYFNWEVHEELARSAPGLSVSLLPTGTMSVFANRITDVTPDTAVIHLVWCSKACKLHFLERLYAGATPADTQQLASEYVRHHKWTGVWS